MLSKELEKRLVALHLKQGVEALEAQATGQAITAQSMLNQALDAAAKADGRTPTEARERRAEFSTAIAGAYQGMLAGQETFMFTEDIDSLAAALKQRHGVTLTVADKKALGLKLLNNKKQLHEAEYAVLRGEWSPLEILRSKVEQELASPYYDLKTVLGKYREWYLTSKPTVTQGSKDDMEVECRVLLEIFGNISIADFNTMDSVTKLKKILLKYPKNKQQRFGDRDIHALLRSGKSLEVISLTTANNYIKRAKDVVFRANKWEMLQAANAYEGELFRTEVAAEDQRSAYDTDDIKRLIDAICTQSLWRYNPPRPERFWIVLIALFHGFRLGNIIALKKGDICQTDKGTWVFRLRKGKRKATVRSVAICDSLLLLGFLQWVDGLKREKLFQDTADSFSKFYNRDEVRRDGYISQGFESRYVTTDKTKCLYSLRHSFAGNVFDVTDDYKITADMMGHSTGSSVTARYTKLTKIDTLKEMTEKMHLEHIDLDRLEARAKELFGL